ncbi:APC family permease [Flavobacterium nackdongense]|uniref:APC family permease n=1 Tax=Flavobacterium nackdongense TaxID=2547394 RepID=A0A4P6YBV3_9FLAO|nr:APC family permease [Flavobacterium nackdongense]QBN18254.1 APC family permease [Flavobacterium nackdongense]
MNEKAGLTSGLKKVLGLTSLFIITIGIVVSQTSVVSIVQGAGLGGGTFFMAIFIAFIIALCYISTYSELALMMPKAGSISTYTAVSVGHFMAIIASLSAYAAPALFGALAELLLLQNVLDSISPSSFTTVALAVVWTFTFLNIFGIDLFASVQSIISFTMLVTLIVIGIAGLGTFNNQGLPPHQIMHDLMHPDASVFTLVLAALWPFIAFEMVCDFIEEAKNPVRHIPKAMFTACIVLLFAYSLLAFVAMKLVPAEQLAQTDVPHLLLGKVIFGNVGKIVILILSITTTCGFISTGFATTPRLLYGMAHHKQLPPIFMRLHSKWRTPWIGILVLATLLTIAILLFKKSTDTLLMLVISGASCYLLAYIITHIDLIVLRKKYPNYPRSYKSPFFPLLQIVGILGMTYAFIHNSPSPELRSTVFINVALFIGLTAVFAFCWVKFKMKKGLFEAEPIEQAIDD